MLDYTKIRAISLDLDDTLWPVWPTIQRAEKVLEKWLSQHAPMTAALFSNVDVRTEIREHVLRTRPELRHDLSSVRREAVRVALYRAKENPLLAEAAFEVFFDERNKVVFFEDALAALEFLSTRFPVVALSNGNADIARIGVAKHFKASVNSQSFGSGKPHAGIFHAAAKAAGTSAEHVLHIGDDAALDVIGGLGAGMQTVWLNRTGEAWEYEVTPHLTVSSLSELCEHLASADVQ